MPLDTSIALGVQNPQIQSMNPASVYQMVQEQRTNALRNQLVQQEMAKNALSMQYTAEDRRAAAAQAAATKAKQAELMRTIQSGYIPAKNAVMGPGTIQGSTPAKYDADRVLNALYAKGDPTMLTAYSNMQEQVAKQKEAEAKVPGTLAESDKKKAEAIKAGLDNILPAIGRAGSPDAVLALFDNNADVIRGIGQDPEKSKRDFLGMISDLQYGPTPEARFQNAIMQVSDGVMKTREHIDKMLTGETARNKPIEMDLGGKKVWVDPVTLQPKAEFAKTLTPDEANKSGKTKDAKASLEDTLARLDEEYSALSGLGAQPTEKDSVLGNLGSKFTSSYIGQTLGVNPQAQTHIQAIEGLRNDVLLAIKAASGMSAKEMDSNAELQRQLAGATAPGQNIESVRRRLTDLSKKYGVGKDYTKAEEKAAKNTTANAPAANNKGWALHTDANGNRAYVSPDGTQFEEVK